MCLLLGQTVRVEPRLISAARSKARTRNNQIIVFENQKDTGRKLSVPRIFKGHSFVFTSSRAFARGGVGGHKTNVGVVGVGTTKKRAGSPNCALLSSSTVSLQRRVPVSRFPFHNEKTLTFHNEKTLTKQEDTGYRYSTFVPTYLPFTSTSQNNPGYDR